jgi:hypothetical protein
VMEFIEFLKSPERFHKLGAKVHLPIIISLRIINQPATTALP